MATSTRSDHRRPAAVVIDLTQEVDFTTAVIELCVDRNDDRPVTSKRFVTEAMVVAATAEAAANAVQLVKEEKEMEGIVQVEQGTYNGVATRLLLLAACVSMYPSPTTATMGKATAPASEPRAFC